MATTFTKEDDMGDHCEMECELGDEACFCESPSGLRCTREVNHPGEHVACSDLKHAEERWE